MDNFDYDKFNPNWVYEFKTIFYKQKIRKNITVKKEFLKFLEVNRDSNLERYFFEIFVRK